MLLKEICVILLFSALEYCKGRQRDRETLHSSPLITYMRHTTPHLNSYSILLLITNHPFETLVLGSGWPHKMGQLHRFGDILHSEAESIYPPFGS